jgi:hypothetical protein
VDGGNVPSAAEYEQMFLKVVPEDFLGDMVRVIVDAYPAAADECFGRYPRAVAHDLVAHVRRAKIESGLQAVADKHREIGLMARDTPNRRSSAFHTLVRAHHIVVTESMVRTPDTPVRRADFRTTYARSSQLSMFVPVSEPDPSEPLYAIVLHGPDVNRPSRLGFIHVRFPLPDGVTYVGRIDLLARFQDMPAVAASQRVNDVELITEAAEPTLRPVIRAREQDG